MQLQCDNARPTCAACGAQSTRCHYPTQKSETRYQALIRENKELSDLLKYLSTAPDHIAQTMLHELRSAASPLSVLRKYEADQQESRSTEEHSSTCVVVETE